MDLKYRLAKLFLIVVTLLSLPGCILLHRKKEDSGLLNPGDQPDKVLYERAVHEIGRNRYDVGRLTLQTLVNTYPDSEYLSRAKLSIADSYYSEGGVSGLTQAEVEYKDFITFFPTAPEAPEAQFRAGMAHYRLMAKSDRDRTEAKLSEAEFKEFLLKYPDSQVMPRVKSRLRQVQEVLAQGDYRIAQFYYLKRAYPAARSRFEEIADSYPNFSNADDALWYMGQALEQLRKPKEAANSYARILTEHPLSDHVEEATARLTAMKQPIPRPTRAVLARAQADAAPRLGRDLFQKLGGFMSNSPDVSATRHGPVRLGPPKPAEVEVAKGSAPTPGGASIIAQPVGEDALKAGTPVARAGSGAKPDATAGASTDPAPGKTENDKASSQPSPPKRSKKRPITGLFDKILHPF